MNAQHQRVYTYPSHSYTQQQQQQAYSYQIYPQNQWIQHQHHQQQQIHPKVQPVFERIEHVIRTCNSVSRCLDTALMSSHSGLTAFFRVLHQFQSLKQSLGHILGFFSLVRYFKAKATKQHHQYIHFSLQEFEKFRMDSTRSRSWYCWLLVLLIPFVIHYISLLKSTPKPCISPNEKQPVTVTTKKKLDFARARYAFEAKNKKELSLQCNDLIAVISRDDNDWWYGRLKNGNVGYFPANHVELIKKN